METAFLVCAVIGGTLLVIQTLMLVFGGVDTDFDDVSDVDLSDIDISDVDISDLDTDMHADAVQAHDAFLKMLSVKTVVAFLTFFGLSGLAAGRAEFSTTLTLVSSVGAGLVSVYIVAWLMTVLARLQSRGNLNLAKAPGSTAKVYVLIPAARKGSGKVTLALQGRMVECKAVTDGAEISTGTQVKVVGLIGADTLQVNP